MKNILEKIASQTDKFFVSDLERLVSEIRPKRSQDIQHAVNQLINLTELLKSNPDLNQSFKHFLLGLAQGKNTKRLFTDAGILSNEGFFKETSNKISQAILPSVYHDNDFTIIFNRAFSKRSDYVWAAQVPIEIWSNLLQAIGLIETYQLPSDNKSLLQILNSMLVISQRITAMGLEPEMIEKLPELEEMESPFLSQNREIIDYVEHITKNEIDRTSDHADYKHILVMLTQCEEYIQHIRKNRNKFGASLALTYLLQRLNQNIVRLRRLMELVVDTKDEVPFTKEIEFFQILLRAECKKNSLKEHFESNISLLAFQITEHAGKTGEHYITRTPKEYFRMLLSAMGGGMIVGFLTIIKVMIYYMKLAPFGEAFLYSMNYSLGFIGIHVSHSTLATKQPAMTASKLAGALDVKGSRDHDISNLADFIVRLSRSQFIAFVGNVLVAFPVAYFMSLLYFYFTGEPVAGSDKAYKLIAELHPTESYAVFHAGIAGVYLFLSGLISGYYDNKSVYNKIPQRINKHPFLRRVFGEKATKRFGTYIENNLGSLAGNFFLGIFLGTTGTIGFILGLPLDIRHITFSSGNFGIAMASLGSAVHLYDIISAVLGIIAIGIMNFTVSFSLATFVAIRSRNVNFKETRQLLTRLSFLFFLNPAPFFFPPREKVAVDVEGEGKV
ncbi:site-specific recombinase [Penaeicola halotolerans]|uniref:site-specific recombinase n=1 Tax=Penaeicola halotolerans TaxID=2793196 RepID=UPI001CF8CA69|nr:site-specific recombinase [Penaeicola halotolerans]